MSSFWLRLFAVPAAGVLVWGIGLRLLHGRYDPFSLSASLATVVRRLGLALVASALVCCQPGPDNGRELPLVPDEVLIVPGERVGALVLGQSTPDSIATYVDREQFATEQGLDLQFDRKHRLSIITVFSPRFSTREGLRVGSLASEVEATLGSPRSRSGEEKHGKFKVPALIYDDIGFVTQDERVVAIGIPGE